MHNKVPFTKPELSVEELTKALYNANLQLSDKNKQLIESESKRKELFSNLSHDLRSPIASLKSYLEYLTTFADLSADEIDSIHHKMTQKVSSLENMINDMLQFALLENISGDNLNFSKVNITHYLKDVFNSYSKDPRFMSRNLKLDLKLNDLTEVSLDSKLFKRALDNLITNALKYSEADDTILLKSYIEASNLIISISDTGMGISEENIRKIFQHSYRVATERTPNPSIGCGLGLSIVESIVTQHGGSIWCESVLGEGSIFFITLPHI